MKARWLTAMGLMVLLIGGPLGPVTGCGKSDAASPSPLPAASEPGPTSYALLEEGTYSQITQVQEAVVRDQAAWAEFYRRHAPSATLPTVDFGRKMVVAVVLQRNTGGYLVRLDHVKESGGRLVVTYTETRPSPNAVLIQVLTQPFFFATVTRSDLPVTFEHVVVTAPTP